MAAKKRAKKTTKKAASKAPTRKKATKKAGRKKATKKKVSKKVSKKASKKVSKKKSAKKASNDQSPTVRQGDKAAFVRSLPRSMPASEVVDRASEKGMIISKAYVHNIRSAANKAARALMSKEGKKKVKGSKSRLESQFRELVITLGPARAKKLLSQVETSLSIAGDK